MSTDSEVEVIIPVSHHRTSLTNFLFAFVLIWQLVLPNVWQTLIKPQSIHLPSVANEWSDAIREDLQFQTDVERIDQELARLRQYNPFPFNSTDQDFQREVQSIERQIQYLEYQSERQ